LSSAAAASTGRNEQNTRVPFPVTLRETHATGSITSMDDRVAGGTLAGRRSDRSDRSAARSALGPSSRRRTLRSRAHVGATARHDPRAIPKRLATMRDRLRTSLLPAHLRPQAPQERLVEEPRDVSSCPASRNADQIAASI
jgi:hypothetical protein